MVAKHNAKEKIKIPTLEQLLDAPNMPAREDCRCGAGLPEIEFNFGLRRWSVWCGCGVGSDYMETLELAIFDFNTKNRR